MTIANVRIFAISPFLKATTLINKKDCTCNRLWFGCVECLVCLDECWHDSENDGIVRIVNQ